MGDKNTSTNTNSNTNSNANSGSEDFKAKFEHANGLAMKYAGELQTLKSEVDKFKGIDIEKLKKDSTELQKMLESSTKPEDIEAAKKRIEDAVASKVTNLETENSNLKGLVKTLRVTNDAMKLHSTHFVEKSEAEIEGLVNRFCDWDEKSGQVVVKDKNGEIRYSKTKGGQFMSVEEYFEEIKTERPYLAKSSNNTGSMSGSANSANSGNSAGISKGSLPPGVTDKASMKAYFEKNPEVLQDYLNGRLN